MEIFTKLRDLEEKIREEYDFLKKYSIDGTISREYINKDLDFIDNIYKLYKGEFRLVSQKVHINIDKYRYKCYDTKFAMAYDYTADNFLRRIAPSASEPKIVKRISIKDNLFTLEKYDPTNVSYFHGQDNNVFSILNEMLNTTVELNFEDNYMMKRNNYNDSIAIVEKGEPILYAKYIRIDNKAVAKIESFKDKSIFYLVNLDGILNSYNYKYENYASKYLYQDKRIIEYNEIPIVSKYDEYDEPIMFNHQDTFLGELNCNDEKVRVYLYPACILPDNDIIFRDENLYYLDKIFIDDENKIQNRIREILIKK